MKAQAGLAFRAQVPELMVQYTPSFLPYLLCGERHSIVEKNILRKLTPRPRSPRNNI